MSRLNWVSVEQIRYISISCLFMQRLCFNQYNMGRSSLFANHANTVSDIDLGNCKNELTWADSRASFKTPPNAP